MVQAAGDARQPAIDAVVDVVGRAGAGDELTHQHEQRHDGEDVVAQRLVGRRADEVEHLADIAEDEVEAHHRRDAESGGDVQPRKDGDTKEDDDDQSAIYVAPCLPSADTYARRPAAPPFSYPSPGSAP